jgi:hypothetical protein
MLLLLSLAVFREASGPKIFHIVHTHTLGSQNRLYYIEALLKAAN